MMHLLPHEDQLSVRESAAALLQGAFGAVAAHDAADGRDRDDQGPWSELAAMGWFGLGLPDEAGGAGLGPAEEALVFIEAGRALAPVSVLATVLAAHVAHTAGNGELLAELLSGRRRAGFLLRGDRTLAIGVDGDDAVLVALDDGAELHVALPERIGPDVSLIDPATRAFVFSEADPEVRIGASDAVDVHVRSSLLVAAYLTGIASRMLDVGVAYAREREAFGRPIGAFQAIKHRLADVAMDTEVADAQVVYAAVSLAQGFSTASVEADAAKVLALKAALDACGATIQTHGALGVTWEFDAHLFLSRARALEHVPDPSRASLDRLGSFAGVAP